EQSARMGTPAARLGNTSYAPARSYNPAGNNGAKSDYSNTTVYDSDNGGKDLLAAYTPKQTRQEKQALNQKIADFSSGLEKAFVQALQPKSKREQNIEKYLNHSQNSTEPTAAASVSAPVEQQIAAQAKNIVQSVGKTYGPAAAQKAGKIMNDFQKDMADVLNKPTTDAVEKEVAARKVNNKYNEKLQKLNEDESLKKMREQLAAENAEYLKKVEQVYGANVASSMRPILDDYANKRLAIWSTPLSEGAAVEQELALQEQVRKSQEDLLQKYAKNVTGDLTALQNEVAKQRILQTAQQEKDGTYKSPLFYETAEAKAERENAWKKEGQQIVQGFSNVSAAAATQAQKLVDDLMTYRSQLRQEAREKAMTEAQVAQLDMQKTEEVNQQLQDLRVNAMTQYYNQSYEEQFKNMPEEVKAKARSVWEKYNQERADLLRIPMSEQAYQNKMNEIEAREQKAFEALQ
ncbi:MAG: hypothetical protein J6U96_01300, partial [Elusimicrobiaceae bacterium]|nr:hypothetical protein [Elusimicrobiaceae bacterium]